MTKLALIILGLALGLTALWVLHCGLLDRPRVVVVGSLSDRPIPEAVNQESSVLVHVTMDPVVPVSIELNDETEGTTLEAEALAHPWELGSGSAADLGLPEGRTISQVLLETQIDVELGVQVEGGGVRPPERPFDPPIPSRPTPMARTICILMWLVSILAAAGYGWFAMRTGAAAPLRRVLVAVGSVLYVALVVLWLLDGLQEASVMSILGLGIAWALAVLLNLM